VFVRARLRPKFSFLAGGNGSSMYRKPRVDIGAAAMPLKNRTTRAECMSSTKKCVNDTARKTRMLSSAKARNPNWVRILIKSRDRLALGAM
jgi:hypothetical protein